VSSDHSTQSPLPPPNPTHLALAASRKHKTFIWHMRTFPLPTPTPTHLAWLPVVLFWSCAHQHEQIHKMFALKIACTRHVGLRNNLHPVCSQCAVSVQSVCQSQCAVSLQSVCNQCAVSLQSVCSQCAVSLQSVCSQCAVSVQSVCSQCAVSVQSVCSQCAVSVQSVCSQCAKEA